MLTPHRSSRLIIRNLAPTTTPASLREHLESPEQLKGCTITDIKVVAKRRFAFVGYKSAEEARKVKEWWEGAYLGGSKVRVEEVRDETRGGSLEGGGGNGHDSFRSSRDAEKRSVKVPPAYRSPFGVPSEYSMGQAHSTASQVYKLASHRIVCHLPSSDANPPLQALGPKHASRAAPRAPSPVAEPASAPTAKDERLQEFMDVMKNKDVTDPSQLEPTTTAPVKDESGVAGIVDVVEELDDAEWLKRRQAQAAGKVAEVEATEGETVVAPTSSASTEEQQILATGRLFIRNLSFLTTPEDISTAFSAHGTLEEVHVPVSQATKQPLGTAFVQYKDPQAAVTAWREMDGRTLMGRLVHILPGRPKHGVQAAEGDAVISGKVMGKDTERNVKADIDKKRKEQSGKGLNWATLYMNSDAVASSVAARMGISKADILNADSTLRATEDDAKLAGVGSAVKLALAETSVIAETKAYFEDHGVILDRLTETTDAQGKPKRTPRSRTMLLVKNIPYGTDVTLLNGLFEPHGPIRRLLLPPAGTLAVVEYENEDDASRAFKAVNYRRLGSAVVYLEKAPEGLIDEERSAAKPDAREEAKAPVTEADMVRQRVEAVSGEKEEDAPTEAGSTLFVKNLSFTTTTERLQSVFSSLPSYSFARVSTKPDPKNPSGPRLSMGFGFVGFATRDAAAKAMAGLKGFKLDGHDLDFKYAMRDGADEAKESKADAVSGKVKSKTTKMIVKNVPFEASKKDIRDLFSAFGTLKSCRLPKKHNSTGRGFAFLDFTTRHEAEAAMNALKHTHLLGRHLVLEWAETDGDLAATEVEKLRQKTKSQFVADGQSGGPSKKRKLDLRGETDPDDVDM